MAKEILLTDSDFQTFVGKSENSKVNITADDDYQFEVPEVENVLSLND